MKTREKCVNLLKVNNKGARTTTYKDTLDYELSFTGFRSSHRRCSVKKCVLRNFAKFTGKHLCQRLFFNKVAGLRPTTLLKKRLWHRCFTENFAKFLRTPFLQNTSEWQLLYYIIQEMKFLIKDSFSRCDQIYRKPWIWSHLLKKPSMENFIFCAVLILES